MDLGHWHYPGEFNPEDWFGFIYRIIDLDNNREYIGKKQLWSVSKKAVPGKRNRKVTVKASDWKKYSSSSTHIKAAITLKGKDNFLFLIESLHKTKASLHYSEVEYQVDEDVLRAKLPNGDRKYYNGMIANIKFLPPEATIDEIDMSVRQKLMLVWQNEDSSYFNGMTEEDISEWNAKYRIGHNHGECNPMYGRTGVAHHRYGVSHTQEIKDRISSLNKGRNIEQDNSRFGKSPFEHFTEDQITQHRASLSDKMLGQNNPMFGKPCYHAMSDERREEWKKNISEGTKGIPKSAETREKMRKPKGPQETVQCPHCQKIGGASNLKRYHFDNCSKK